MPAPTPEQQERTIDTDGGAYVEGPVDTGGGDFVGRDVHIHSDEIHIHPTQVFRCSKGRAIDGSPGLGFWAAYLAAVGDDFESWHIPTEIQRLINWQVEPVPLDDYIALRPVEEPLPLFDAGSDRPVSDERRLKLSEVVSSREVTSVLIIGSSGAGKSTCLKYLCYHSARDLLLTLEQPGSPSTPAVHTIPVYVALRSYGPDRLSELIAAQFHRYGLPLTGSQLGDTLENTTFQFLFDGLDEVSAQWRQEATKELEVFHQKHPQHHIVVTARTHPQPPHLEGFLTYEIEPLDDRAVNAFVQHYLGEGEQFDRQIRQRALENVVRIPLLLTMALIVFRLKAPAFDSLAGIYQEIVRLYEGTWEERKRTYRLTHPLPWDILEEALSDLAYQMVSDENRYTISHQEALQVLQISAQQFSVALRWPGGCTVDELLDQLLIHNFLELQGDDVSFWHASFRDYFAALAVLRLLEEQIVEHAKSQEWLLVFSFVGGLLEDPTPVRDALVQRAQEDLDDAYGPVYALGLMGQDTTSDIIRACSRPVDVHTQQLAETLLASRGFAGTEIFAGTWMMLQYLPIEEPDWDEIGINRVLQMYESVMLALSLEDLDEAHRSQQRLYRYLDSFNPKPDDIVDPWLSCYDIDDLDDFCQKLRAGRLAQAALLDFCRNTVSAFSLPYLESVFLTTEDYELRQEAHQAIQSVLRHDIISVPKP
jgi:hypothetical protein